MITEDLFSIVKGGITEVAFIGSYGIYISSLSLTPLLLRIFLLLPMVA